MKLSLRSTDLRPRKNHMGSKEDIASKIEAETKQKMNDMNQLVAQHKKAVIEQLLTLVYAIDPQVHRNYRP
ncbi:hypothetical protein HPB47_014707 [Ixodes persulcatus]|uniref:Uncharacterized protein n=1 Tax=Ixodes persulcatus TaxID=34615 RepID=A0AC60QYW7_IXOPE|nr:hypothetical protein HPB47_014707 [Ixodes persulcatus]